MIWRGSGVMIWGVVDDGGGWWIWRGSGWMIWRGSGG